MHQYVQSQEDNKNLGKEFSEYRLKSEMKITKLTKKYNDTYKMLKSMQEDVMKPLIQEVKIKEELHERLVNSLNQKD